MLNRNLYTSFSGPRAGGDHGVVGKRIGRLTDGAARHCPRPAGHGHGPTLKFCIAPEIRKYESLAALITGQCLRGADPDRPILREDDPPRRIVLEPVAIAIRTLEMEDVVDSGGLGVEGLPNYLAANPSTGKIIP